MTGGDVTGMYPDDSTSKLQLFGLLGRTLLRSASTCAKTLLSTSSMMGAATLGPGVGDSALVGCVGDGGKASGAGRASAGSGLIWGFFFSLLGSLSMTTLSLLRPNLLMRMASLASSFWRRSWRRGLLLRPVLDTWALAFLGAQPDDADEAEDVVTGVVLDEAVELVVGVDV